MKKGNELVKVIHTRFTLTMLNVSHKLNVKDVVDIYLASKQNTAEERVNAGKEEPTHTILEWQKVSNCGKNCDNFIAWHKMLCGSVMSQCDSVTQSVELLVTALSGKSLV